MKFLQPHAGWRRAVQRGQRWFGGVVHLLRGRGFSVDLLDLYYAVKPDPWGCQRSALEQRKYREILEMISPQRFANALEVGCGEGVFTSRLAPRVGQLTALDSSSVALQRARSRIDSPKVHWLQADLSVGFAGEEFDLILACEVLYYLGQPSQIEKVARCLTDRLQPGGELVLCHMRTRFDDEQGFPIPRWIPPHVGARTIHGIFESLPDLEKLEEVVDPLYRIGRYRRV